MSRHLGLLKLICCTLAFLTTAILTAKENPSLVPYFSYSSQDLERLRKPAPSQKFMSLETIKKWDNFVYDLMGKPLPDGGTARFVAYLYNAQRDAAYLSYSLHNTFLGTLDPITLKVIQLFFPDFRPYIELETDDYSQQLSEIVFSKIRERWAEELKGLKSYPPKIGPTYWTEKPPVIGQKIGSCRPWLIKDIETFRAQEPPPFDSLVWLYGLLQIKQAQAQLSPQQTQLIYYWAGRQGPQSGNWIAIANHYMESFTPPIPLADLLFIRSVLAMGLVDALIAAFDSKYTYWVMRPHMRDPSIKSIVPIPRHPSYPSAHSVSSSAVAIILCYYFPDQSEAWKRMAIEAGNTRIWGGLHFVFDHEQGMIQGEKVGKSILNHLQLPQQPLYLTNPSSAKP